MAPLSWYSRWDGSQRLDDLDADQLLEAMSDDLLSDGDLWSAMRKLFQRGARNPDGPNLPGLQDLLNRLRRQRQQQLDRFDLSSVLDDIKQKLDKILQTEREGIERRVNEAREKAQSGQAPDSHRQAMERAGAEHQKTLDELPATPAGRIQGLQSYEFMDPDAHRMFWELMKGLQQQMLQPFLSNMQKALGNMTPQDLERMREMLRDLNRMLRDRAEGREPDFEAFKQKWGDHFPGAQNLDQLMEQIAQQSGQMQSLLGSMSPGQRRQLQDMMQSLFLQDERLEAELAQLGMNLGQLMPLDQFRKNYQFRGDDDLTMKQAMELMDELQQLDQLERQLQRVRDPNDLEKIDPEQMERLLGEEARRDLERLRELTKKLEEAGYLERKGDRLELTARAIRKIGDKALRDIFTHLKRDRFGSHELERRGHGGDRTDQAKPYEFGDPFLLELRETLMNAVERNGAGVPVRLHPDDFEVVRTETQTHAATVLMLDMSRSMIFNGCFLPAKKVALALNALIRGQFPRDSLYIVGFSLYAREFSAAQLPHLAPGEWSVGTNMHAGFLLARQLLARHKGGNRQVIMITDGEPTAHMEGTEPEFAYPPTRRTIQETLKEVQRCTRDGITINTFMLEQSHALTAFVEQMTRINRGRAFFATSDRLGEYVLVDFVRAKRRAVS
jgi:uncharacterized protein with von Willebrand factor type A (vWA) domain